LIKNKDGKLDKARTIKEKFGGTLKVSPTGNKQATAKINQFFGKDPKNWVRDISTYDVVDIGEIYHGVQLKLRAHGKNVEKFFYIFPGTDPKVIRSRIEGVSGIKINQNGELIINTGSDELRLSKPQAFQYINGNKTPIEVSYALKGNGYGFQVAGYDKTRELIIDPLINAFFIGESKKTTVPKCMATDKQGNIYIAGTSSGHFAVYEIDSKLKTLLGSTLFGTNNPSDSYERTNIYSIAVDGQNNIYLAGYTDNDDFPATADAFDNVFDKVWLNKDGFVTKFNSDLNSIIASTFIGGGGDDRVYSLAIDKDGNVYVAGQTSNPVSAASKDAAPFPTTTGAFDTNPGPYCKTKAFVMKLDRQLHSMLAGTLLGYDGNVNEDDYLLADYATEIKLDASGNVVVAGVTESAAFPITSNCADSTFQGKTEMFVSKFDPDLHRLLASTFIGGLDEEKPNALAVDANDDIFIAGWTKSSDFPVVLGSFDTRYNLSEDGFVTKLDNALTSIIASTFIGGDGHDQVCDLKIKDDGTVLLGGGTTSTNFPTTENCDDPIYNGGKGDNFYHGDGFLARLDNELANCSESTYLGGNNYDHISSILVNNTDIVATGETWSENFPYVVEGKGYSDAFIGRFNDEDTPLPLPIAGPGHWKAKGNGRVTSIYLDINICNDGSFSGNWRIYLCKTSDCRLDDSIPPNPVSGRIDFQNNGGTINFEEKCKDISFVINKQSPNELGMIFNPDKSNDDCSPLFGANSYLFLQGASEPGKCQDTPNSDDADADGGSGGGGGGCYINSIANVQ
jgi:hypothetical protein